MLVILREHFTQISGLCQCAIDYILVRSAQLDLTLTTFVVVLDRKLSVKIWHFLCDAAENQLFELLELHRD